MKKSITLSIIICCFVSMASLSYAEQCVDAVRALVPWTSNWTGNANEFPDIGRGHGLTVNNNPSGCTENDPCVLVYHPNYGSGIDSTNGHVVVLYNDSSPYSIQDSNGICGGYREECTRANINLDNVSIIHPCIASVLTSGISKNDYVSKESWNFYKINASSSYSQVKVEMTNLSNDVDLYVRKGSKPSINSYDCRPYSGGTTSETCTEDNSGSNLWHIGVQGFKSGNYTIKATLSGVNNSGDNIITLSSGVSKSGSVSKKAWKYYKISASSAHSQVKVEMTNLSNDVDLYVRKGSKPSTNSYDCRPYSGGTTSETCTEDNSGSNLWYIGVQGFKAGSYSIKAILNSTNTNNNSNASPGDICSSNSVYDCVMTCVNASIASNWTGDNYCDNGAYAYEGVYYNLRCPAFNNDGGDCN